MRLLDATRNATRLLVLVVVWVALWGEPSVGNIVAGVLVALGISWLFPAGPTVMDPADEGSPRVVAAVRFLGYFAGALVVATWEVVREVLRPRLRLAEAIVAVPLVSRSPVIATLVGNAVSLTPGTLTVEIGGVATARPLRRLTGPDADPDAPPVVLYVHVFKLDEAEDIRADGRRIERLAVAAFGSAEDRRRIQEVSS